MLFNNQIFSIFLNRIIRLLPKGEFSRNISILAGSSALAQGISVLTAPIITRLYGPSDYGIVAAFSSVISLILVVATFRFEWAIPNPKEDGVAINVFIICFIVTAVVGIIAFPIFLILSNIFKNTSIFGTIAPYIWLIPLYIFGGASYQTLNAWAIRKKKFYAHCQNTPQSKPQWGVRQHWSGDSQMGFPWSSFRRPCKSGGRDRDIGEIVMEGRSQNT